MIKMIWQFKAALLCLLMLAVLIMSTRLYGAVLDIPGNVAMWIGGFIIILITSCMISLIWGIFVI